MCSGSFVPHKLSAREAVCPIGYVSEAPCSMYCYERLQEQESEVSCYSYRDNDFVRQFQLIPATTYVVRHVSQAIRAAYSATRDFQSFITELSIYPRELQTLIKTQCIVKISNQITQFYYSFIIQNNIYPSLWHIKTFFYSRRRF